MTDRPVIAPIGNAVEKQLPLRLGEQLRISDLVDAAVTGNDRDTDGQRSRPGAAADFVDPQNRFMTLSPELSLHTKSGSFVDQDRSQTRGCYQGSVFCRARTVAV